MWDDGGNYSATECNRELSILLPFGGFFSTICPWALQVITYYENMDIDRSQQSHHATLVKKIQYPLFLERILFASNPGWHVEDPRSLLVSSWSKSSFIPFSYVMMFWALSLLLFLSTHILESKIGLWRSIFISAWCIFHARDRQVTEIRERERERALHVNGLNFERPSCSKTLSTLVNILSL